MSTVTFSFDLSSAAGLAQLEQFMEGRSFLVGFKATKTDVAVFKALGSAPNADKYPNLNRFYQQVDAIKGDDLPEGVKVVVKSDDSDSDSDDDDLFGSDDEDNAEAKKAAAAKAKELAAKKAAEAKEKKKKAAPVAKTQVVWEVKPMDAETDLDELEQMIRNIKKDGLVWGQQFNREEVAFGIKKLVIQAVIEDDKVDLIDVEEPIENMEDHVQSIDLCTMNRL